jgi:DNA polymerase-1
MTEKLVLAIDGTNWVHRAWHAPSVARRNRAALIFCDMIEKADRSLGPTHIFVAFDHPSKNWRHDIFPAYKAEREEKPPELVEQLDLAYHAAQAYGCQAFCIPGYEADDVLATIAARATAAQIPVIIGSSDKDLMQLCTDSVRILDPNYRVLGPAEVASRWNATPDRLADVLALMGDSADGVPGVDGIGPATAASLVAKYGSAMGAVDHAAEVGGKRGAALAASRDVVAMCLRLVDLRTDAVLGSMLTSTKRTTEAFAAFRKKLEGEEVSRSVPCWSNCGGVPGWRDENGYACVLCGGSGVATTYNERALQAKEWDEIQHRSSGSGR